MSCSYCWQAERALTGSGSGEVDDKVVLDAAIVAGAQAVEHYEICRNGALIDGPGSSVTTKWSAC
jgi:hypothetical protein